MEILRKYSTPFALYYLGVRTKKEIAIEYDTTESFRKQAEGLS